MSMTFPDINLPVRAGFQIVFFFLISFAFSGISSAQTFSNTSAITINDNANASPYPSTINVSGVGTVYKVTLTLNGLSHTYPDDLDMMLVAPNGAKLVFMSYVCGEADISNTMIIFDDSASSVSPDNGPCTSTSYRPSAIGSSITFPAPAPAPVTADYAAPRGTATFANKFNGINANGNWSLYVRDHAAGDIGSIANGWSISFNTYHNPVPITLNDNTTASVYPSTVNVSGIGNLTNRVNVTLNRYSHTFPADMDMLLVAPNGTRFLLASDACGGNPGVTNSVLTFSDTASTQLPDFTPCPTGSYRPASYGTATFPTLAAVTIAERPVTFGSATFASRFSGIDANGAWRLYLADSAAGDTGSIAVGWSLSVIPNVVTSAPAALTGRVTDTNGRGISNVRITIADTATGTNRIAATNQFGIFTFDDLEVGTAYLLTAEHKRYTFQNNPRIVQLFGDHDIRFTAEP